MTVIRMVRADGLATVADDGSTLDAWFAAEAIAFQPAAQATAVIAERQLRLRDDESRDELRRVSIRAISLEIDLDVAPASTADAYLRLQLLSYCMIRPNQLNLDGMFTLLPTVVWTQVGPMLQTEYEQHLPAIKRAGLTAVGVDKFPRLTDYLVPRGVRIADAARVRLGAHLAPGTTVMHEGFVNFNAGTLGASMIEGRISQGVVVGHGSDIGGGASIMGTLSGGGSERITIGERALLGANAGIGISIGADCVVEAGLYVTAGTKVRLSPGTVHDDATTEVKARELSGVPGLLFRRNSIDGAVEALPRSGAGITLNAALHA